MYRFFHSFATVSALALGLLVEPAGAHHSGAMYDYSKFLVVNGVVREFAWTNPHVTLWVVDVPKDDQAPKTWFIQSTSPGNMIRRGWTRNTFKAGDRVKVTFHPLRDGTAGGTFMSAILVDTGKEITAEEQDDAGGRPQP